MFTISGITCTCCFFGYFFKPLQPTASQVKKAADIAKEYMEQKHEFEHEPSVEVIEDDNKYIPTGTVIERLPRQSYLTPLRTINPETPFLSTLSLNTGADGEQAVWGSEAGALDVTRKSLTALNRPLSKPDVFYPGSTQKLNERTHDASGM